MPSQSSEPPAVSAYSSTGITPVPTSTSSQTQTQSQTKVTQTALVPARAASTASLRPDIPTPANRNRFKAYTSRQLTATMNTLNQDCNVLNKRLLELAERSGPIAYNVSRGKATMADMNANVQGIKRASMEMAIILQDLKELKEEEERRKALTGILLVDDWR